MKRLRPRKCIGWFVLLSVLNLGLRQAFAQTTISGTVTDAAARPLVGISIQVKGKVLGTITNNEGHFTLHVSDQPPVTLVISSVGFAAQEITVTEQAASALSIILQEQSIMASEVVVSASRMEESVMKSPVSIEKLNVLGIRESPQPSFYDALQNLKGVEMSTQSLTFRSVNTRGFASNGNTRLVQLMDGMDNQAPGLNFPVGNVVGMSELDVESVELLPGAASALYGPNAINGLLLMNSKSPFTYQGVSAYVKTGVMSASNRTQQTTAFYDVAVRFAKAFNDRFAFKANVAYLTAKDWQATDYRDQSFTNGTNLENNVGNTQGNPTYDGVNWYGDVGANLYDILYGNGMPGDGSEGSSAALGAIYTTPIPQIGNATLPQFIAGADPAQQLGAARSIFENMVPQYYQQAPGYSEQQLTDYPTKSLKLNASLHYRINDDVEAILQGNWGKGSTIYTAADRYNIQNFTMGQYKAELRGDNFFVRGYTTRENSGDAHALGVLGSLMGQRYLQTAIGAGAPAFVQNAYTQYAGALLMAYQQATQGGADHGAALQAAQQAANAHAGANREQWMNSAMAPALETADGMFLPRGSEFDATMADIKTRAIPMGANFLDRSNLYHAEAMYNFKRQIDPGVVELIAGANYRVYDLNSEGTLFALDNDGNEFNIREWGAYVQAGRNFNDIFKLTASLRYDKNENFKGQFSPRISGVLTVAEQHNFRASFQRGFRIPTTQNQYIDLNTPQARLVGGLPLFRERYDMISNPVYALTDIQNGDVTPYQFKEWEPEKVETYEIGYKSAIDNRFFVDVFYYYNRFLTFEGVAVLVQLKDPGGSIADLADPTRRNVYSMPVNAPQVLKNSGWGVGLDYLIGQGYTLTGNVTQNVLLNEDKLRESDPSFITFFNSPEYRFNVGFSNRDIGRTGWGVGLTFRHQTEFLWNGSIGTPAVNVGRYSIIPAYSTFDAQVSKKIPAFKSIVKLGGTNIGNKLYTTGWGNPSVGGMYYVSITFDELLN
ncbi:membrane protein [Parapedobacter pyrenivorans]|uniref:Membrane protein n=1 Tax=Parapedobacter pyrenivorans TaxID=1305674 RepID=A0A917HX82_9SPHI|nr:TonB-dependent receptor [Parapedobacter pyrenivorans]GGG93461.1 membrane protein [Parapedobacter pyrenivorans]